MVHNLDRLQPDNRFLKCPSIFVNNTKPFTVSVNYFKLFDSFMSGMNMDFFLDFSSILLNGLGFIQRQKQHQCILCDWWRYTSTYFVRKKTNFSLFFVLAILTLILFHIHFLDHYNDIFDYWTNGVSISQIITKSSTFQKLKIKSSTLLECFANAFPFTKLARREKP